VYRSLPRLLEACCQLLGPKPLFVILTLYAVVASAIHLQQMLAELTADRVDWSLEALATRAERRRACPHAVYARWLADEPQTSHCRRPEIDLSKVGRSA
jgi:hypothetical protein